MSMATQTTTPHQTPIMTDDTDLRNIKTEQQECMALAEGGCQE